MEEGLHRKQVGKRLGMQGHMLVCKQGHMQARLGTQRR